MNVKDISNIRRFLGVVEGVVESLPEGTKSLIYDYISVVDDILDKEENNNDKA